jgi:hypothetical protein
MPVLASAVGGGPASIVATDRAPSEFPTVVVFGENRLAIDLRGRPISIKGRSSLPRIKGGFLMLVGTGTSAWATRSAILILQLGTVTFEVASGIAVEAFHIGLVKGHCLVGRPMVLDES